MREINLTFSTFGDRTLPLGQQGENLALQIKIDCTDVLEEYTNAYPALTLVSPDNVQYPGDVWVQEGIVLWQVRTIDTNVAGRGTARLDIVDSTGTVVRTALANTVVQETITPGEAPSQIDDWLDASSATLLAVNQALLNIDAVIENANAAADNADTKAEDANDAAAYAREKGDLADEKATLADTKAGLADTAASAATDAASAATTAAGTATTAAGAANDAALAANTAAGRVDAAIADAQAATEAANTAAGSVGTAIEDAGVATTAANRAAEAANYSAGQADSARQNALAAASEANTKAGLANTNSLLANEKAGIAAQAAADANTAALLADEKAGMANTAASAANAAAARVDAAISEAETATTAASNAADLANTKAELADTKATAANTAAQSATSAASAANTAATNAQNATGYIAPTYDATKTYVVGDYVIYNGGLYRCATAIDTAEEWTASHWSATDAGSDLSDLKSHLNIVDDILFQAFDYSELNTSSLNINAYDKWQTNDKYVTYYLSVPENAKTVRIIANKTNGTNIALIASTDTHKHGANVVYATGWAKTFISAGQEVAFDVPDDCAYIWFAKKISGTVYEPVYAGFHEGVVPDITDLKNKVTELESDKTAAAALASGFIHSVPEVQPMTGENKIIDGDAYDQFSDIIALWDALMVRGNQYGTYVTKCWIDGTAYDNTEKIMSDVPTAGDHNPRNDMNQYPLIMYKFKPYLYDAEIPGKSVSKKILIVSGTHGPGSDGDHLESPVACYYFAKRLIENFWVSDSLINIRNNYEIDFIPVANPWGINNRTRRNGQNIDINRDYSAFETVTAQQIKNLVDSGEYQMLIDSHCLGGTSLTGGPLAGAHYRFFTRNAEVRVIGQQLTNFIGAKYSVPTIVDTGTTSTTTYYANSAGIIGITTEIPANTPLYYGDRTGEPHGKDVVEHDVDFIQNVIAVMSNYLHMI